MQYGSAPDKNIELSKSSQSKLHNFWLHQEIETVPTLSVFTLFFPSPQIFMEITALLYSFDPLA
jgi:hypothetical protein